MGVLWVPDELVRRKVSGHVEMMILDSRIEPQFPMRGFRRVLFGLLVANWRSVAVMKKQCIVFFFVVRLWRVASCLRMSAGVRVHTLPLAIATSSLTKPHDAGNDRTTP